MYFQPLLDKGDQQSPKVRSRVVTKEIRRAKPVADQLSADSTFASTPPTESVMALLSLFLTRDPSDPVQKNLGVWDISRAHFMGTAKRRLYIQLPSEDLHQPG